MSDQTKLAIACVFVVLTAGSCFSQNEAAKAAEQPKYFHLDFALKELEGGKVLNARNYSTTVVTGDTGASGCSIRAGNKVPTPQGGAGSNVYTFVDVGVNIDCRNPKEVQGDLALYVTAEVSSVAAGGASTMPPMIRQTKWSSNVIVPMRKPTVVFSSDDPTGKGQMQLELTASPLK